VIQKLIENLPKDLISPFLDVITQKEILLSLIKDANGNHIILKFLQTFPESSDLIFATITENLMDISFDKHGCCAIQKCFDLAPKSTKDIIINIIIKHSLILIVDQYANYVVQFIFEKRDPILMKEFALTFKKKIVELSKQKFASNVLEKFFEFCDNESKNILLKELANSSIILELLLDNFGNFVLQKALKRSDHEVYSYFIHVKILNKIVDYWPELV
jgi:hypothetical protein